MKVHPQTHPDLKELADHVGAQTVALLSVPCEPLGLDGRPMTPLEMDTDGGIWMMTARGTIDQAGWKGGETAATPGSQRTVAERALLSFCDPDKSLYVTVNGQLEQNDDPQRKHELWTLMGRPWFDGPDDPDLTLLVLRPRRAEVWDGPRSTVVRAMAMAASVAAGREIGMGEHKVLGSPGEPQPQVTDTTV